MAAIKQVKQDNLLSPMSIEIREPISGYQRKQAGAYNFEVIPAGSPQVCTQCNKRSASGFMIYLRLRNTKPIILCFDCKKLLQSLLRTVYDESYYDKE